MNITQLGISVDSGTVAQGAQDLKGFSASAKEATKSTNMFGAAAKEAAEKAKQFANVHRGLQVANAGTADKLKELRAEITKARNSQQQLIAASERMNDAQREQTGVMGLAEGATQQVRLATDEYRQALVLAANGVDLMETQLDQNTGALQRNSAAARQAAFRQQQLVYQYNDIITSLVMGQNPMMVATAQGGQLAQVYGGQGGLNAMLRETGNLLRSVGAVLWRMAPIFAGVGAAIGVSVAALAGLTHEINKTSDVQVKMGDVMVGTWNLITDQISNTVMPVFEAMEPALSAIWQGITTATAFTFNQLVRMVLVSAETMKVRLMVAGTAVSAGVNNIIVAFADPINDALADLNVELLKLWALYNSIPERFRPFEMEAPVQFGALTNLEQRDIQEEVEDILSEGATRIGEIMSTDYATAFVEAIGGASVKAAKRRLAEEMREANEEAAQELADALTALDRVVTQANERRLSEEGNFAVLQALRYQKEINAINQAADAAIAAGADVEAVNILRVKAQEDAQIASDLRIKDEQDRLAKEKADREEREREEAEREARRRIDRERNLYKDLFDIRRAVGMDEDLTGSDVAGQARLLGVEQQVADVLMWERERLEEIARLQAEEIELYAKTEADKLAIKAEYDELRLELERTSTERQKDAVMQGYWDLLDAGHEYAAGQLDTMRTLFGEQSGLYKAAFIAEKGYAIAKSVMATHSAAAQVLDDVPFPFNIAAAALVTAKGVAEVATIAGLSYGGGRERGGGTERGKFYEVNERGKPELLQENGKTFLLPGGNGRVTPFEDASALSLRTPSVNETRNSSQAFNFSIGGFSQVFQGTSTAEDRAQIRQETEGMFEALRDDIEAFIERRDLFETGRV